LSLTFFDTAAHSGGRKCRSAFLFFRSGFSRSRSGKPKNPIGFSRFPDRKIEKADRHIRKADRNIMDPIGRPTRTFDVSKNPIGEIIKADRHQYRRRAGRALAPIRSHSTITVFIHSSTHWSRTAGLKYNCARRNAKSEESNCCCSERTCVHMNGGDGRARRTDRPACTASVQANIEKVRAKNLFFGSRFSVKKR
jgi:hypothetical protein